jgi:hypothetical protein
MIEPYVANENAPSSTNVVQVEAYKGIVGEKRKGNEATLTEYATAIKRATKVGKKHTKPL